MSDLGWTVIVLISYAVVQYLDWRLNLRGLDRRGV